MYGSWREILAVSWDWDFNPWFIPGREAQNEMNERMITTLGRIEAKVDVLQLETAHLRRVK